MNVGTNKGCIKSIAAIALIVIFMWAGYFWAGKLAIRRLYEQDSFLPALNKVISGQDVHSLGHYYSRCEALMLQFTLAAAALILLFIGYLAIPKAFLQTTYEMCSEKLLLAVRNKYLLVFGAAAVLLLILLIASCVLLKFPNSGDEHAYIFQAKIYNSGKLWVSPHPHQDFFECWFISSKDGKLFSQVPFGWPALLALALRFSLPLWALNPIIGVVAIMVLYEIAKILFDAKTGLLAALLMSASPYFLLTSASYFSHTLCSLLILSCYYFLLVAKRKSSVALASLAGIFLGWSLVTRYYSAAICALPVILHLLTDLRKNLRILLGTAAGAMAALSIQLAYNLEITGNAFLLPYNYIDPREGLGFIKGHTVALGLENAYVMLRDFLAWTPITLLLIYVFALKEKHKIFPWSILLYQFPIIVMGHILYWSDGGNGYGPRYYYEAYPFMVLAVSGYVNETKRSRNRNAFVWYLLLVGFLVVPVQLGWHLYVEGAVVKERMWLYDEAKKEELDNAVVFLKSGIGGRRPMGRIDLTRNAIDFSNDVLFVMDRGEQNAKLMEFYEDKSYYLYSYDKARDEGELRRIR